VRDPAAERGVFRYGGVIARAEPPSLRRGRLRNPVGTTIDGPRTGL
jgi:hypothetical protein